MTRFSSFRKDEAGEVSLPPEVAGPAGGAILIVVGVILAKEGSQALPELFWAGVILVIGGIGIIVASIANAFQRK